MERRRFLLAGGGSLLAMGGLAEAAHAGRVHGQSAASKSKPGNDDVLEPLMRWALGYDTRNVKLMRSAFSTKAKFILRPPGGSPLVFNGIDAVMKLFTDSLASQTDVRRHVTTNSLVENAGNGRKRVTSLLTLLVVENGNLRVQSSGIYRDIVVWERGAWRIRERDLTLDVPS